MPQIMDENQTCKEMRSQRKGMKVQFTIKWQLNQVGLLLDQLRQSLCSNATFNCRHDEKRDISFEFCLKTF